MRKFFLIPLMSLLTCVMAFANVAQITFSDEREAVDCADLADLQTAIAALPTDGTVATIKLLDDINATSSDFKADGSGRNGIIVVTLNQNVVLDLNGHTISGDVPADSNKKHLILNTNGILTIDDNSGSVGVIHNTRTQITNCSRTVYSRSTSDPVDELHLKKCKIITESGCGVVVWGKLLTIEDGVEIETRQVITGGAGVNNSPAIEIAADDCSTTVTINGGTFTSLGQAALCLTNLMSHNITINGGTFKGHNDVGAINGYAPTDGVKVEGGLFSSDPYDYLDQGVYRTYEENGYYKVQHITDETNTHVYTFAELKSELENATASHSSHVTIMQDIVVNEPIELKHGSSLTIPVGKTLSIVDNGLFVNEGITINNGAINITGSGFFSKPANVRGTAIMSGASVTLGEGIRCHYEVNKAMDLQWLSYLIKQDEYLNKFWFISLNTDITIPEGVYFEPIDFLNTVFNGNGHKISGLKIRSNSENTGVFRQLYGAIYNVTFEVDLTTVSGTAGAVVGILYPNSELINVTVEGAVSASGQTYGLGGFVGKADRPIIFEKCVNKATVSALAGWNIGGFVGSTTGSTNTNNLGLYNCSMLGNVRGYSNVGALIGYGPYNSTAKIDVIAMNRKGSVSATSPSSYKKTPVDKDKNPVDNVVWIGSDGKNYTLDYTDPAKYLAVYDENEDEYVAVEAGTLDNKNSTTVEWEKSSTWTESDDSTPVVPNASDSVTVNNASGVVVNDGIEAEAKIVTVNTTLTVNDGGKLTIGDSLNIKAGATVTVKEGATLVVGEKGITIADGGKLVIETGDGNTLGGTTAVVLVSPDAEGEAATPEAEITFIPDAYKEGENAYQYRYFGIPLDLGGNAFSESNWTRELVDPADAGDVSTIVKLWDATGDQWQDWTSISQLQTFKGYAITNNSYHGVKYTFKGKLMGNGNGTMQFANGYNLFANSYTAPINIETLLNGLSNDVRATIYMFVGKKLKSVSKLDFNGFRTPAFEVIPSMQGFFVLMDDGTEHNESVDYRTAVYNNTLAPQPLYAPQRQETPDFNRVRINIAAENGANDEVYLIEAADYTNDFENGYDEAKFMNNGLNLFATTAYGRQSTEITNELNGTFIGVQGNGTYTMSFDELVGEEYQIRDLQTNAVVTMSEANTYTFTANGTDDARFVVESIAKMPTALNNVDAAKMFINNNTLYISENNTNANIMIYAANGQLVLNEVAQPTISLNGLASGVYTVRVANQTLKFVK